MKWLYRLWQSERSEGGKYIARHWSIQGHTALASLFTLMVKLNMKTMRDDLEENP